MGSKVFFCEETPFVVVYLRRFVFGGDPPGPCAHDATSTEPLGRFEWPVRTYLDGSLDAAKSNPLWPTNCDRCGYLFQPDDQWQAFMRRVYRRTDTGEELPPTRHIAGLPVGAVVDAWWSSRKGVDGRALCCITPGGEWMIDGRASNCTRPEDGAHHCWVRHGRPEDGSLHVDKDGDTCAAGAGSIIAGAYHGFLHHGELTPC